MQKQVEENPKAQSALKRAIAERKRKIAR